MRCDDDGRNKASDIQVKLRPKQRVTQMEKKKRKLHKYCRTISTFREKIQMNLLFPKGNQMTLSSIFLLFVLCCKCSFYFTRRRYSV